MNKHIKSLSLIYTFYLFFAFSIKAQPVYYNWAHNYGGTGTDVGGAQVLDAAGNIYATGTFSGTGIDFDPGPGTALLNSNGNGDVYFAKYKNDGSLIWAKSFGGPNDDGGLITSIAIDNAGNIVLYGNFNGTNIDFDPGTGYQPLSSLTGADVYLAKYDGSGNYIWAFSIDAVSSESPAGIKTDAANNVYICGGFAGNNIDFDPSPAVTALSSFNPGTQAIFFAKYNSSGNLAWVKSIVPSTYCCNNGNALCLDNSGNIYVGGYFGGSNVDFDPGAGSATLTANSSLYDFFFAKYDSNGNYIWANHLGYTSNDNSIYGLTTDLSGNVYVGAYFWGTIDADPGPGTYMVTSNGLTDAFIAKFDGSGNFIFCKTFGGNSYDDVQQIALDNQNNLYVVGGISGSGNIDLDPGPAVHLANKAATDSSYNCYISKFDANGNYIWATSFGGLLYDHSKDIVVDSYQNMYVIGIISGGPINVDPGSGQELLTSNGNNDIFMLKYSLCPIPEIISATPSTSIDQGNSAQLYVSASGSIQSYQWKFNNTNLANSEYVRGTTAPTLFLDSAQIAESGTYTCEISDSCGTTLTADIHVLVMPVVKVFEVITPNGDNKNDAFYIQSIDYYTDNEVIVYNRWGNMVYNKTGYKNEEWNGDGLPDGSYFYVVKINSIGKTLKGGLLISK